MNLNGINPSPTSNWSTTKWKIRMCFGFVWRSRTRASSRPNNKNPEIWGQFCNFGNFKLLGKFPDTFRSSLYIPIFLSSKHISILDGFPIPFKWITGSYGGTGDFSRPRLCSISETPFLLKRNSPDAPNLIIIDVFFQNTKWDPQNFPWFTMQWYNIKAMTPRASSAESSWGIHWAHWSIRISFLLEWTGWRGTPHPRAGTLWDVLAYYNCIL